MTATFAKLDIAPAYRQVFDAVEGEIVSGRLRPGDRLPSEAALAEQFGVNRSTIREGIRLLEQGGLVHRESGKRLRVSLPHYQHLASRASRAMVMHQITFHELWETSMTLEMATVHFAADRINNEQIAELEDNVAVMRGSLDDTARFIELDIAFHNILSRAARNRALSLAREPISLLFFPAGKVILPRLRTHARVIDAHAAIIAELKARDGKRVVDWMRRHMEDFKRGYERTGLNMNEPLDAAALGE